MITMVPAGSDPLRLTLRAVLDGLHDPDESLDDLATQVVLCLAGDLLGRPQIDIQHLAQQAPQHPPITYSRSAFPSNAFKRDQLCWWFDTSLRRNRPHTMTRQSQVKQNSAPTHIESTELPLPTRSPEANVTYTVFR